MSIVGRDRLICDECGKSISKGRKMCGWAFIKVTAFDEEEDDGDMPYVIEVCCEECHK